MSRRDTVRELGLRADDAGIGDSLVESGFWRGQVPSASVGSSDWNALIQAAENLPHDSYAEAASRYRTFNRFELQILTAERARLRENLASAGYAQSKQYNPELGGVVRRYERNPVVGETNSVLEEIVSTFAPVLHRVAGLDFSSRFVINVHQVRYLARAGMPSRNSPSGFHKDGERFISVHLLARHNIAGDITRIASNDKALLEEFTLVPGECFLIDDEKVWHSIGEMSAAPRTLMGTRDILLIDYLPFAK
jgi:hypothetical protein